MQIKRILKLTVILLVCFAGIAAVTLPNHGKYFEISKNIEIFTNLYKEINTYYVDEIDPAKLMRTGVDAMLESLDPYTNYISESEIESFRYMTEGKYNGIGAQIKKIGDYITITEPYEGQPGQVAGLKAGDVILSIDGKSAKSKSVNEVSRILKGFPGTEVALTIRRPGEKEDKTITLVRGEVSVPNVPYHGMISENIGYFTLTTFTRNAGKNVANALKELKEEHPELKGVVFDLRGNGGGLLTEAVNVTNVFVPKGELIVTTKGKVMDWDRSFKTLNKPVDESIPLVLLINHNSASASEIVSGVIQDLDRGVLIGQHSYGKGLVQNTRDVGYNSKVKLTTAKYYIPSGRCIQSVEYNETGNPVIIDDEKRTVFNTRNGREVFDGGGIKPDLIIKKQDKEKVILSLQQQNMIFDYATQYCLKHDSIENAKTFRFPEYDDFLNFLEEKEFDFKTTSDNLLDKFVKASEKEGLNQDISAEIQALEKKLSADKKKDLINYKDAIIDLMEKEIVTRYYYQRGKIEIGLRNDPEVKQAIDLLNDSARYNSLLKK